MFFKQIENLLPKKLTDRVALKTSVSKIQLHRSRGYKKLNIPAKFTKFSKITFGVFCLLYFSGYQPAFSLPPLKQSLVRAEFSQQQIIDASRLSEPFILPHPGYLTTRFSSWHPGIDIATGLSMPVHPVTSGKIAEVIYGWFGLGHYIIIEHEQGFKSTYGHMGKIFVKKDDLVTSTSILGEVGMTGNTSGPHTHLEITKDGQYIDPQLILPSLSNWPTAGGTAPTGKGEVRTASKPQPTPKPEVTPTPYKLPLINIADSENTKSTKLPPLLLSPLNQL